MIRFPGIAAALTLTLALDLASGSPASASRRDDQPSAPSAAALAAPAPEAPRLIERRRYTVAAPVKELASQIVLSNGIEFDTRAGEPPIPAALRSSVPAPGERMSLLVQVEAPIQSAWAGELQRAGAQVVCYVPNYAFLVRIDAERRGALDALPFVRWTGLYHTAYRISGQEQMKLRSGRGRYQILLFGDGDLANVSARVAALGGVVEDTSSRVNRILRIELDRANVEALASHPDVQWIEPREEFHVMNDQAQWVDQTGVSGNRKIWDQGLTGAGQVVMLGDSGIRTAHNQFRDPLVPITTFGDYPTHRKIIAYQRAADTTTILFGDTVGASYHGTHTSCTFAGNDAPVGGADLRDGLAKDAKIYFLDAGASANTIITPGDLNDYFQPAYTGNTGGAARVSSNSWGSDTGGAYTITCMSTDQFVYAHPDFLVSFSNGNAGSPNTVGSPAAAKNILSAGGTQNGISENLIYSGTSRGPTHDSRFKPTVCSPGQNVFSANGAGNTGYVALTGTSMASPNLAGSATLVRQYFTDGWYPTGAAVPANSLTPSAALLRAMIVNSGTDDFAAYTMPDNNIGWGRILLDDVLFFPGDTRRTLVLDESDGVTTGEVREYEVQCTDASQPLEISLVWTDRASTPSASIDLVNDIDLIVEEGANTYLGNAWSGGQSVTGGSGDNRNVEENFRRVTPVVGTYVISVEGANVPFGPQPYAIVVTGGVGGSSGVVFLDKGSYGPTATVGVHVEDADGGGSVSVTLTSPSEPGGETVSFAGANGIYDGSIQLTLASANGGDGKLSVSQGDAITATYTDSSPAHVATATASVDVDDPTITNVAVVPADITAIVSWTTNTLASSRVEYGTTTGLGTLSTLDPALVSSHSHQLAGLVPMTTYYFDVLSTDHEGNLVRDNFGGMHYRFTTGQRADVLLVFGDDTTDKTYRYDDALKSTGWSYNTWQRPLADNPPLGDSNTGLRSFKAVWWQVGWEQYPPFGTAQRDALTSLHDGGARIAFVSHDVAWAFTDPTSGYQDASRTAWFNNTMHSTWQADPLTWATINGIAADPISGAYTGGVPYTPFRSGGAGDEVDKIDGAGTASYVWRDTDATPDDIGVRWESSANLGSPGVGVWGGQKTRTVAMFLEWIQFNAAVENDATRAAILDKTLQYLIGGDHPDVAVVGPNGGENFTTSPVSVSWTTTTDVANGRTLASTRLEYSDDGGSSWTLITASPGASPYSWNVSALPSASTYRVRAIAADNGSPSLSGTDASNANFTINIPGNETRGPVVIAGSPGVSPTPITIPNPATLVASITDALTGGSNVTQAEWSVGVAPAAPGAGTAMTGPFGTVQVAVSAALPTPSLPSGATTLWIRGRDAAGNWGPAGSLAVQVNGGTSDAGEPDVAVAFSLGQNFPNPFERGTSIRFALPAAEDVNLKVFNVQGRLVRTLLEGHRAAGRHVVNWDGRDEGGNAVSSGVYFYRLTAGSREAERRMTYLR